MTTKQLRINGQIIHGATEFAYDGCHKIYLIFSEEDREYLVELGYEKGDCEILPVSELPLVWAATCPLRFISRADLTGGPLVPQNLNRRDRRGAQAEVTWS